MSTFTYTIEWPDGRIEHRTGTVTAPPDGPQVCAKGITLAACVPRRAANFETAATWLSWSPQSAETHQP